MSPNAKFIGSVGDYACLVWGSRPAPDGKYLAAEPDPHRQDHSGADIFGSALVDFFMSGRKRDDLLASLGY
jgi:hypothetical protein